MLLKKLRDKYQNYSIVFDRLTKGWPVVIRRFGKFYKIAPSSPAIKQLNREVRNAQSALKWDLFSNRVVALEKVNKFIAAGPLIRETEVKNWKVRYRRKQQMLMKFSIENLVHVLQSPTQPASEIIGNRIRDLEIDIERDHSLYSHFRGLINDDFFQYSVPVTPMHGDFLPGNTLLTEEKLLLIDWEYALEEGSVIYDWWYLRYEIEETQKYDQKVGAFFTFIDEALEKLNITYDQFQAFGYAMIASAYFSAYELDRTDNLKKCGSYVNEVDKIVSNNKESGRN